MPDCPYCGKKLVEGERYCYFCDQDTQDKESYKNKPGKPVKERMKPLIDKIKSIFNKR